ncbi:metal-dependent transcriptional regulator [Leucobacter sp. W1478]|uniref:metal-dependent transcriptional regulator n=1 Tax=Leucobacter sp. W1478 TaxID=3439065 RepID=UPI003F41574A
MALSELTPSSQNYLKAVWGLQEWTDAPVTPSLVAEATGMKLSTVSDAVRRLADKGLVDHAPYGAITLTEGGRAFAIEMVRRHRLIETFLVEMLGYSWDLVHDEAEALEHSVSDFMIDRLDALLGYPARDPHGDPIPSASGEVTYPDAKPLSRAEPGSMLRIERISDDDPALLQYFSEHGLAVGTTFEARMGSPFSDALEIIVGDQGQGGASFSLGRSATDAVWVSLVDRASDL